MICGAPTSRGSSSSVTADTATPSPSPTKGILAINVIGSCAMGLVAGWFALRGQAPQELRLFLTTGILGGFTTFSAFSLDGALLYDRGQPWLAATRDSFGGPVDRRLVRRSMGHAPLEHLKASPPLTNGFEFGPPRSVAFARSEGR